MSIELWLIVVLVIGVGIGMWQERRSNTLTVKVDSAQFRADVAAVVAQLEEVNRNNAQTVARLEELEQWAKLMVKAKCEGEA